MKTPREKFENSVLMGQQIEVKKLIDRMLD
jgi:hypothetical protein